MLHMNDVAISYSYVWPLRQNVNSGIKRARSVRDYAAVAKAPEGFHCAQSDDSVLLTPELIEEYLETLQETGCTPNTLNTYRMKLTQLYQYLPEDKRIRPGTLTQWQDDLLDAGYAPSSVNVSTAAANGLIIYCGHRELQTEKPLKCDPTIQPELTRNEYLRLLSTAKLLEKEQVYLLIKVLGSMGLALCDLPQLTVQAVQDGKIRISSAILHIPGCLQEELLDYIHRKGFTSGPVFVTKTGKPIRRTSVTAMIRRLCRDAQVPCDKATPRCLRKLYQTTQASIQENVVLLVEQAYDRLLEKEQLTIGWK